MKKIYTLAIAFMVLLTMTMGAIALDSKTINRQNGNAAVASWSAPDGSSFTDLSVTQTKEGTDIFVFISTPTTFKVGSLSTQENVFDINKKLTTATLSPVDIELFDLNNGTSEIVTVNAQWEGVGDLTKNSYKFMSKSGEFTAKFSDSSIIRDASARGSINGQELGISDFAELIKFKSASMTIEK